MKKGFSLPLWVAGAARSALKKLVGLPFENYELIKIPNEKKEIKIEIHSVGLLKDDSHALGITFAKSGLDLDITQNLEIWTIVSLEKISFNNSVQINPINIISGSGVDCNFYYPQCKSKSFLRVSLISRMIWDKGIKDFVLLSKLKFQQLRHPS